MKEDFGVSFHGYNENVLTFECTGDVHSGSLVTMDSSQKVRVADDGECFIGVALSVRDGFAAVQLQGYFELKTDEDIPVGRTRLVASRFGRVKSRYEGIDVWVIATGEIENEDGICEDWIVVLIRRTILIPRRCQKG